MYMRDNSKLVQTNFCGIKHDINWFHNGTLAQIVEYLYELNIFYGHIVLINVLVIYFYFETFEKPKRQFSKSDFSNSEDIRGRE